MRVGGEDKLEAEKQGDDAGENDDDNQGQGVQEVGATGKHRVRYGKKEIDFADNFEGGAGLVTTGKQCRKDHHGGKAEDKGGKADEKALEGIEFLGLDITNGYLTTLSIVDEIIFKRIGEDFDFTRAGAGCGGGKKMGDFVKHGAGDKKETPKPDDGPVAAAQTANKPGKGTAHETMGEIEEKEEERDDDNFHIISIKDGGMD